MPLKQPKILNEKSKVMMEEKKKDPEDEWNSDEFYDSADDEQEGADSGDENASEDNEEGDSENEDDSDNLEGEEGDEDDDDDEDDEEDDAEFEQQSSSDEEGEDAYDSADSDDELNGALEESTRAAEETARSWKSASHKATIIPPNARLNGNELVKSRDETLQEDAESGQLRIQQLIHTDDLSSDDEEATGNTIGRVPLHWYDAYDHIGYDISGHKILKRKGKDRIDMAISNSDDPVARRTVYDMYNDREIVLSEREIEIIRRIQAGAFAHPEFNDTPDYIDYFSSQKEVMPLSAAPEAKRSFLPSKWEVMKVLKIVKAMQEGRYKSKFQPPSKEEKSTKLFMIWDDQEDEIISESRRYKFHLPAPKIPLPGHAESYNPPEEYLLSEEEQKQMEDLDPKDRPYNFIPKKHSCLRHVAGYQNFLKERFERCLDLYLCPRKLKARLNIDPETLVPRLPKPSELRPYPNSLCMQFLGHSKHVRSISLSPDGQYLASGSDDGTVRLWEVDSGLCRHVWALSAGKDVVPVTSVQWNPNPAHHIIAAAVGNQVVLIATGTGDADSSEVTESLLAEAEKLAKQRLDREGTNAAIDANEEEEDADSDNEEEGSAEEEEKGRDDGPRSDDEGEEGKPAGKKKVISTWHVFSKVKKSSNGKSRDRNDDSSSAATAQPGRHGVLVGPRIALKMRGSGVSSQAEILQVIWHYKGDYFATMAPSGGTRAVAIHQLSKAKTQCPFTRSPGQVQYVSFHPSRPFLFVATQQHVKVYHLVEQKMVKKLLSGCKWISCIDIHSSGDHVLVGSYDRRVVWFDLDLSSTPYKTLKFHEKAVRSVQYHKRYPLMASAADDGTVHVFHSTVYSDLTRNPLIVPLKVLRGHGVIGGLGVLSIVFHPRQPWIFSSGADGVINLYQDI